MSWQNCRSNEHSHSGSRVCGEEWRWEKGEREWGKGREKRLMGKRTLCVGIQHFYHAQLIAGHRSTNWVPGIGSESRAFASQKGPRTGGPEDRRTNSHEPLSRAPAGPVFVRICMCVRCTPPPHIT